MDPNATWKLIQSHLKSGNVGEAIDAAVTLSGWLNGGGFFPNAETLGSVHKSSVWAVLNFILELSDNDIAPDNGKALEQFGCFVRVGMGGELEANPMMSDGTADGTWGEVTAPENEEFIEAANAALGTQYQFEAFAGR